MHHVVLLLVEEISAESAITNKPTKDKPSIASRIQSEQSTEKGEPQRPGRYSEFKHQDRESQ
jgi:hypothetical protein